MTKRILLCYVLIVLSAVSAILHHVLSSARNTEEAAFFVLTLVLTVGFVASVLYNTVSYIRKGKPDDLWKLGWIGLLGGAILELIHVHDEPGCGINCQDYIAS